MERKKVKVVRYLSLKETIERSEFVKFVKTNPQAQVTLLAGTLAVVGGGLKLAANTHEFDNELFTTSTDGNVYRIKAKKCPTIIGTF